MPRDTAHRLAEVIEAEWGEGLVRSWNEADWYGAPETTRILCELCNARVFPSGGAGTYTSYARAGDHIAAA